ncbi:hypothetical protein HZH68_011187 [Vespula germanica]|uniref:Ubiquitin-like domain-containing protein n=1 Tax=Vespula germanica TaxID=30212 RepID=A0A834JNP8_VESGE|nr:hypothetical protein HZH68_011187 [Vespula germanica]
MQRCGCVAAAAVEPDEITISITPTTGGQFDLTVDRSETIENLKKIISKRLKVAKERICLLHLERQLRDGTLEENRLQDGSRLTLLPSVETGLLAQRPEQSVMQALESLNDSQVNDFLSGKAPLNLTMRLGDHMMLIQLQLSTVRVPLPGSNQTNSSGTSLTVGGNNGGGNGPNLSTNHVSPSLQSRRSTVLAARSTASTSAKLQRGSAAARTSSLVSRLASALHAAASCSTSLSTATKTTSSVCSSRATTAFSATNCSTAAAAAAAAATAAAVATTTTTTTSSSTISIDHLQQSTSINYTCSESTSSSYDATTPASKKLCTAHHVHQSTLETSRRNGEDGGDITSQTSPLPSLMDKGAKLALDTRALAEASRNLTQKLKQLSSEVFTSRVDLAEENARHRQGAMIESMHHHGKGVYSGTFSGTINPALQDRHGRPKRDISTIIHILNDLLCATPAATAGHYRHHHRHSNSRQQCPSASNGVPTSGTGTTVGVGCHDSTTSGHSLEELSKENEATKGKMRRLRLVMEQRRTKRKARREARAAPHAAQWAAMTPDPISNHDASATTASTSSNSNTAESQNEPDLQPCSPEPVVA